MKKYAVDFEKALYSVAERMKSDHITVCSEDGLKWSIMGVEIWLEFEVVNGKTFVATNHLHGKNSINCHLGRTRIKSSIQSAIERLR